jgi:hypothetical protein
MGNPKTKGRMITKDISDSKRFALLSPQAGILFCMLIPHYDSHGKMNGGPGYIKEEVCPRIPYLTIKNIPIYLKEISKKTNVKWFEHDGRYWIHSTKFLSDHQNLNLERLGVDKLPSYSGVSQELVIPEVEVEVEDEVHEQPKAPAGKRRGNGAPKTIAELTDEEYAVWVKGEYNKIIESPKAQEWCDQFDDLDVPVHIHSALQWLLNNPDKRRSRLKSFFVNWLIGERTRKTEKAGMA